MQSKLNEKLEGGIPFLGRTVVIIPARNEEECLEATIQHWLEFGVAHVRVVDNGSSDKTTEIASACGAEVLSESRVGYGAAIVRGLSQWQTDWEWVLVVSADGSDQLSWGEGQEWQAAIDSGADLVMGDRTAYKRNLCHLTPVQRLGNWMSCCFMGWVWGKSFRDMGSIRLIRHQELLAMGLKDRRYGWNLEMQIRAVELGLDIREIPVRYYARRAGSSKISGTLKGSFRVGLDLAKVAWTSWSRGKGKAVLLD